MCSTACIRLIGFEIGERWGGSDTVTTVWRSKSPGSNGWGGGERTKSESTKGLWGGGAVYLVLVGPVGSVRLRNGGGWGVSKSEGRGSRGKIGYEEGGRGEGK